MVSTKESTAKTNFVLKAYFLRFLTLTNISYLLLKTILSPPLEPFDVGTTFLSISLPLEKSWLLCVMISHACLVGPLFVASK